MVAVEGGRTNEREAVVHGGRGPEFVIVGINPSTTMKRWTAGDSVGWALMMAGT